jgi:predicted nucleic acid-binding protein
MDAYVDSSVVLRVILGEPDRLRTWARIGRAVSSELLRLECLRTIDRARIRLGLTDDVVSRYRHDVIEACDAITIVPLGGHVLARAAQPFPTLLGSLDAIHMATAILVRDQFAGLVMATHDAELARAGRAEGFEIHGA